MEEKPSKKEVTSDQFSRIEPIIPQSAIPRRDGSVLFLCTGNYYRSRFAELFFNHLAERQRLAWRATSRGLRLTNKNVGPIAACTIAALVDRGAPAPTSPGFPRPANDEDFANADLVIAVKRDEHEPLIAANFDGWASRVRYWNIHDVDCLSTDQALIQLEFAVRSLVEELSRFNVECP